MTGEAMKIDEAIPPETLEMGFAICDGPLAAIRPIIELDSDDMNAAIAFSMLATSENMQASEADLQGVMNWAAKVTRELTTLQFLLLGAIRISDVDKDGDFKISAFPSKEGMLQTLIRKGIAKPLTTTT